MEQVVLPANPGDGSAGRTCLRIQLVHVNIPFLPDAASKLQQKQAQWFTYKQQPQLQEADFPAGRDPAEREKSKAAVTVGAPITNGTVLQQRYVGAYETVLQSCPYVPFQTTLAYAGQKIV